MRVLAADVVKAGEAKVAGAKVAEAKVAGNGAEAGVRVPVGRVRDAVKRRFPVRLQLHLRMRMKLRPVRPCSERRPRVRLAKVLLGRTAADAGGDVVDVVVGGVLTARRGRWSRREERLGVRLRTRMR